MKKTLITTGSIFSSLLPSLVLAASVDVSYFESLVTGAGKIINDLVIFLVGLAVVWFIWNVVRYSMSEDEDGKAKAKSQMINGIIAIAVSVSIWGIVAILRNTFDVDNNNSAPSDVNYMIPSGSSAPTPALRVGPFIPN